MKLYNTLNRSLEEFKPIKPGEAMLYTCGPTVYDHPHIGNWRTFVFYDLLRRNLEAEGLRVNHVMNITDVGHLTSDEDTGEDKLTKAARTQRKTAWEIAGFYTEAFMNGMQELNMLKPTHLPKATEYIEEQISFVQRLDAKGYTYKIDDGIYFDTNKLSDYGKLARLDINKLKEGARVDVNPQKRASTDFALWKFSPKDSKRDMEWDSPWGKGFPGWHLECSVMAECLLDKTLDIHAGGIDHIPVHHTNEIAQSEAANDQPLANYWLHAAHLMVNDTKIAKSEGNGITLADVQEQGYNPNQLRLYYLQSHYLTQSNFNWDLLAGASSRLDNYLRLAELRWQPINPSSEDEGELITRTQQEFEANMADNLNTPEALAALDNLVDTATPTGISPQSVPLLDRLLHSLESRTGLKFIDVTPDIAQPAKDLINRRLLAKTDKDYKTADQLRDQAKTEYGLELNDTPSGTLWHRSTV